MYWHKSLRQMRRELSIRDRTIRELKAQLAKERERTSRYAKERVAIVKAKTALVDALKDGG